MSEPTAHEAAAPKLGDLVRLNSGGPNMTVEHTRSDGFTGCVWFVDDEAYRDAFPTAALVVERAPLRVVVGRGGGRGGGSHTGGGGGSAA